MRWKPFKQEVEKVEETLEDKIHRSHSRIAGILGNVMEWYDFALFGYLAPIMAPSFFPSGSEFAALLQTWGIFAGGYLVRPIGASVFGYIGDRVGRRRVLYLSAILMGIATCSLGFLPPYAQIGAWAALLLVLVRVLQGFSVGGEFTGSVTYMVESAPPRRRGLAGSWANVGSMTGILLGSGVVSLISFLLPQSAMESWGWRIPFIGGGVLGIITAIMVRRLHEVHVTKREQKSATRSPLRAALSRDFRRTAKAVLFVAGYGVIFYIPLVYLPTYVNKQTGMAHGTAMDINTASTAALILLIPLIATASDRLVRRKYILAAGFLALTLVSTLLFTLLQHGNVTSVAIGQGIFAVLIALPLAIAPAMLVESFPGDDRLSGYSIAYNIGSGVVGGTTPLVATWLLGVTGNSFAPCFYLVGWAVIAFAAVCFMRDRSREPLMK